MTSDEKMTRADKKRVKQVVAALDGPKKAPRIADDRDWRQKRTERIRSRW